MRGGVWTLWQGLTAEVLWMECVSHFTLINYGSQECKTWWQFWENNERIICIPQFLETARTNQTGLAENVRKKQGIQTDKWSEQILRLRSALWIDTKENLWSLPASEVLSYDKKLFTDSMLKHVWLLHGVGRKSLMQIACRFVSQEESGLRASPSHNQFRETRRELPRLSLPQISSKTTDCQLSLTHSGILIAWSGCVAVISKEGVNWLSFVAWCLANMSKTQKCLPCAAKILLNELYMHCSEAFKQFFQSCVCCHVCGTCAHGQGMEKSHKFDYLPQNSSKSTLTLMTLSACLIAHRLSFGY